MIATSDLLVTRVGSGLSGSSALALLFVAVSLDSGFFLGGSFSLGLLLASGFFFSVGVPVDFPSVTLDRRVTRTAGSLELSCETLEDSGLGESGSALTVMIFGLGNTTESWNFSGTFRTRDDRGEGGTLDSGGAGISCETLGDSGLGAGEVSVLLVSFRTRSGTGFEDLGLGVGEGVDDFGVSFDRTTDKRPSSAGTLILVISFSLGFVSGSGDSDVGTGDAAEGLGVSFTDLIGTIPGMGRIFEALFTVGFGCASVTALDFVTGDGIEGLSGSDS